MNTITKETATKRQLEDIHNYIHAYMETLGECLEASDECGIPIADNIKLILGTGVKSGALGKFDSLVVTATEIIFDVWLSVYSGHPGLYYKVQTRIDVGQKRAQVIEY